jgi:hypothetical protein
VQVYKLTTSCPAGNAWRPKNYLTIAKDVTKYMTYEYECLTALADKDCQNVSYIINTNRMCVDWRYGTYIVD